jgi:hypothetical protein
MDEDRVLYAYKCPGCLYDGQVYLSGDVHDGAPHECSACGAKVFLEWDGGVTFDIGPTLDPVAEAISWREEHGYVGRGGVVVIFEGAVNGWVDRLRNPDHWRPGCIAVDEQGRTWSTTGGTEQGGALMWLPNEAIPD